MPASASHVPIPQSSCRAALRRIDITPPVGIYHRMWGAASHDRSTGVHRPLTATVMLLEDLDGSHRWVAIAVDHCLLWHEEMHALLQVVHQRTGAPLEDLTVFFSHTHAAGLMGWERSELPGGDLIRPYLDELAERISEAILTASSHLEEAAIVYARGRCDLAQNRDYWDQERSEHVCGFNPGGDTDDTIVVGRIIANSGETIGTMVNYACHPTTLAWDNTLLSPDYAGAMREVIEQETEGAPCFFIQGASGDIGPRDGFVGDVEVADRNGRQLGHAALAALESAVGAGQQWQYAGAVVSGATIGTWRRQDVEAMDRRVFDTVEVHVALPYRDDLPDGDDLRKELAQWQQAEHAARGAGHPEEAAEARAMAERMTRRLTRVGHLPEGSEFPYTVRVRRIGNSIWIPLNGEHYNVLQRELRKRFPQWTIIVGTLANGSDVWYLPDGQSYGKGLYQEDASILAKGSLELLLESISEACARLGGG